MINKITEIKSNLLKINNSNRIYNKINIEKNQNTDIFIKANEKINSNFKEKSIFSKLRENFEEITGM